MPDTSSCVCPVAAAVAADVVRRAEHGFQKYGTNLMRSDLSLEAWVQHAYEEALDLAAYLKRIKMELEARNRA